MLPEKSLLSLFSLIFLTAILSSNLVGVDITFIDCNKNEIVPKKNAYAMNWKKAADNVINNPEVIDCLPRNWRNSITTYFGFSGVTIQICNNMVGSNCGKSEMLKKIMVPGENSPGKCGCAELLSYMS